MTVLLAVLCGVIGAYWVVTDSTRVRNMAQTYLSKLVGGRVQVSKANLSIFEGLRLEGVSVFVDDSDRPDSRIFTARTFLLRANLRALLGGRLEATQIMALDPHVHLCENVDVPDGPQRWNYRRLSRKPPQSPRSSVLDKAMVLPEVLLRSGLIQYSRIKGGQYEVIGSMAIDGQLTPTNLAGDHYTFDLDSRAPGQPAGPHLKGLLQMGLPGVSAALENFEFNDTIRAMLPAQVQSWWDAHQLAGRIKIPRFYFSRGKLGEPPVFQIELQLEDVSFIILPEDLLGPDQEKDVRLWPVPSPLLGSLVDMKEIGQLNAYLPAAKPQPIALRDVDGRFVFTPEKIQLVQVRGKIEENTVNLNGEIHGYNAGAPLKMEVTARSVMLPPHPRYLPSLPRQIRRIYEKLQPSGRASLSLNLVREAAGERLLAAGRVQVLDGAFCFNEFPYPLRHVTGVVSFGPDANTGKDRVDMIGLQGFGAAGSRNADTGIAVDGWLAPLDKGSAVKIHVKGSGVSLDDDVREALPPEARQAIGLFDHLPRPGAGPEAEADTVPVRIHGDFDCLVRRAPGLKKKVFFDVALDIDRAEGAFFAFAYPLRNVRGRLLIHNTQVEVKQVTATSGEASLVIDGLVRWGKDQPVEPRLSIQARRVPLDDDFRRALQLQPRQWFNKLALGGKIDVDGRIFLPAGADATGDTDFDLQVALSDGVMQPVENGYAVTQGTADLRVNSRGLTVNGFLGQRGAGTVEGCGAIEWSGEHPRLAVAVNGFDVPMDNVLYQLITPVAQKAWREVRPEGSIDLQVEYAGHVGQSEAGSPAPAASEDYRVTLIPRKLAIKPVAFPYLLQDLSGGMTVTPGRIMFDSIAGRHGDSIWTLSGGGTDDARTPWDISLGGRNIAVDDELKAAVPEGLRTVFGVVKLGGKVWFDWPKVRYDMADDGAKPESRIEIQGRVGVADGLMDVGIPLTAIQGGAELSATLLGGRLETLSGKIHFPELLVQDRPMKDLRCSFRKIKPGGVDVFQFLDLEAKLAGGELAGQVDLAVPEKGSAGYGMRMVLRNVDVGQLVGEPEIKGQLTGSLDIQGLWADASTRHGRGDIKVEGKQLYRVPVVFGLLQVANLSLPVKGPFNEATTRYILAGHRVIFEQIELRAPSLLMQGSGILDFAAKRVQMTFSTDNPTLPKIPLLSDIIQGARKELLQIHVTGSVEEPKVQAKSMNTFTTTVDQVFKSQPQPQPQAQVQTKPKKR